MSLSSAPVFSVIILNWNGRHLLGSCLGSLSLQSFQDFEIILVDNGSTDDSVTFVRYEFPEAHLLELERNFGFCISNNLGVMNAHGKYIVFLNNDTETHPAMLAELYKAIEQDSLLVGSWAVKMLRWDRRDVIDNLGVGYSAFGTGYQIGAGELIGGECLKPKWVFGASGGASCYRRSVLDEIGLFDEDFFFNNEDVDLGFRAQLAGYKCHLVPNAIVYHQGSATGGATSDGTIYHIQRNKEWVFFKNMPALLLWKYLPLHSLYSVAWVIYWILKGKARVVLRAKWDALRGWQDIRSKRRNIQFRRQVGLRDLDRQIDWHHVFRVWRSPTLSSINKALFWRSPDNKRGNPGGL